jgi:AcrR family transcriptional regulator
MGKRDTRRQLIIAAERLYAERGIEGVSLREINLAAGQRNTSAAHYHFGSKEALVDAIFEFRRPELGRRRDQMLDALEASGRKHDVRALSEALVVPLSRELDGADGHSHYLMFLAQLFLQSPADVGDIFRKHQAAEARWVRLVAEAVPAVPRQLLVTRGFLMGRHVVVSLSAYQRLSDQHVLAISDIGFDLYLGNMIDAVAGYLQAPASEQTMARFKDVAERDLREGRVRQR